MLQKCILELIDYQSLLEAMSDKEPEMAGSSQIVEIYHHIDYLVDDPTYIHENP